MNTFKLEIDIKMDNAAFDGNERQETARIIYDYMQNQILHWPITEEKNHTTTLKDINGQTVGNAHMEFIIK